MVTFEQSQAWSVKMWETIVWPYMQREFGAIEYRFLYTGVQSKEDRSDKVDVYIYEVTGPDKKWKFQIRIQQDINYKSFTFRQNSQFGNYKNHEFYLIFSTCQDLFDIFLQAYIINGKLVSIAAIRIEYLRFLYNKNPEIFGREKQVKKEYGKTFKPLYWYNIPPNSHFYRRDITEPRPNNTMELFR